MSFVNSAGKVETWEFQRGTFTNVGSWAQTGAQRLFELGNTSKNMSYKIDSLSDILLKQGVQDSNNILDFVSQNGILLFFVDKDGFFNCLIKNEKGISETIPISQKLFTELTDVLHDKISFLESRMPSSFPQIGTVDMEDRTARLFEQVSEEGNVLFYIDKDGFFNCKNKFTKDVPRVYDNLYPSKVDYDDYTIVHLVVYGQSLALGIGETNMYDMLPNNNTLMFSVLGVRDLGELDIDQSSYNEHPELYDSQVYRFRKYQELKYDKEKSWSAGLLVDGTNPSSGICDALLRKYSRKKHPVPYKMLFSPIGSGGANISLFLKSDTSDTRNYNALIKVITKAKEITESKGYKYRFGGIFWMQGESNSYTREEYRNKLQQLMSDVNEDVKAITGQKEDINWFGYQPTNGSTGVYNSVMAQYDVFSNPQQKPKYIMCAPTYPFKKGDGLHLGGEHYILFGNAFGMRFYDLIHNGNVNYLKPLNVSVNSGSIDIEFNKPIAIDKEHIYDDNVVVDETCGFYLMKNGVNQVLSCKQTDDYHIKLVCLDTSDLSEFYYGTDGTIIKGGTIRENYEDVGWNNIPILFYMPIQEIKVNDNLLDINE